MFQCDWTNVGDGTNIFSEAIGLYQSHSLHRIESTGTFYITFKYNKNASSFNLHYIFLCRPLCAIMPTIVLSFSSMAFLPNTSGGTNS